MLELSSLIQVYNFSASLAGMIRAIKKHGLKLRFKMAKHKEVMENSKRTSKAEKQAKK
jgi:hypothetical protein